MPTQRSISSFFHRAGGKRAASGAGTGTDAEAATTSGTQGSAAARAASKPDAPAPQPAKRQRVGSPTLPSPRPPPVRDVQRAAQARRKLAGEGLEPTLQSQDAWQSPTQGYDETGGAGPSQGQRGSRGALKGAGPKYTPLEQQVVALKQKHPGVLLVIEVGYKFRLFGTDAEVAAQVCNIFAYNDHNFLTAGFPVFRLPVYVRRLVNAGHKVGVVRQVETAAIKSQSASRNAPFERKLTGLFTAATLDAGQKAEKAGEEASLEEFAELGGDTSSAAGPAPKYILYVAEALEAGAVYPQHAQHAAGAVEVCELSGSGDEGGVTPAAEPTPGRAQRGGPRAGSGQETPNDLALLAVEPSTGDVRLGLADSPGAAGGPGAGRPAGLLGLESALLSLAPAEVVVVDPVGPTTLRMLRAYQAATPGCRMEHRQGWGRGCQQAALGARLAAMCEGAPAQLEAALRLPGHAQRVLAAGFAHLTEYGLEGVMQVAATPQGQQPEAGGRWQGCVVAAGLQPLGATAAMVLPANALRQLEVFTTSDGQQHRGSLLHLLDRTRTAAGARVLRAWLAAPLTDAALITARLDAVEELAGAGISKAASSAGPLARLPDLLRRQPDLERGLTRLLHRTAPPSEAVATLLALAEVPRALGVRLPGPAAPRSTPAAGDVTDSSSPTPAPLFDPTAVVSPLLSTLVTAAVAPEAHVACTSLLAHLDVKAARENRTADCLADPDLFADVAEAKAAVAAALSALQELLPGLAKQLSVRALEYVSIQNQGDWLIEVPVEQAKRVPKDWTRVCGTKKVGRYHPPSVQAAMLHLAVCRETLGATAAAAYARFLTLFATHYPSCKVAASALGQLDALLALAAVARTPGYCRPAVSSPLAAPSHLIIKSGKHPMLDAALAAGPLPGGGPAGGSVGGAAGGAVPNDLHLHADGCTAAIITGPNMGGKSCLIRQAALTAIMAQVGSFVPADSCRMTAMDGVFTRMGASDNLLLGRSTFMEELGDAAHILATATAHSLVIMDELGRGTATHDGVAIAAATLSRLVTHTRCLTLFVTHYPEVAALADSLRPQVRAYRMAYIREGEEAEGVQEGSMEDTGLALAPRAPAATAPRITFLFKLREGAVDQSFGLNVAQMAGLPASVVARAAVRAADMQRGAEALRLAGAAAHVASQVRRCLARVEQAASDSDVQDTLQEARQAAQQALGRAHHPPIAAS